MTSAIVIISLNEFEAKLYDRLISKYKKNSNEKNISESQIIIRAVKQLHVLGVSNKTKLEIPISSDFYIGKSVLKKTVYLPQSTIERINELTKRYGCHRNDIVLIALLTYDAILSE